MCVRVRAKERVKKGREDTERRVEGEGVFGGSMRDQIKTKYLVIFRN